MDRLDELALLVAVIDAGGLAAAGRKLRRSPAAMTGPWRRWKSGWARG